MKPEVIGRPIYSIPSRGIKTPFFRDTAGLKALKRLVRLRLETLSPSTPLRVWVPECSSGEDAYSVAICLLEACASRWREIPLCVFSTNSNENLLSLARSGRYPLEARLGVPLRKMGRFFVSEPNQIHVRPFVRDVCRFISHNPVHKPPFFHLDAILCRDILTALPPPLRQDALRNFHRALAPGGILFEQTGAPSNAPQLFAPMGHGREGVWRIVTAGLPRRVLLDIPISATRHAQETFIGEVVHELRSPIAVIRGFVETLRNGVRRTSDRSAFLSFIDHHAVRMAGLVDQLLDLSAVDCVMRSRTSSPVLLSTAVGDVCAAFIPLAKRRGITLRIYIPVGLSVRVDPADFPRLIGNLLDNAVKFTPRGGRIHISGRAAGPVGILSVRDSGRGIAPEDLDHIFERFFRGACARRVKGTGLGLAIVSSIVKANQGWVRAENDPMGGAVFHVALPLIQGGRARE